MDLAFSKNRCDKVDPESDINFYGQNAPMPPDAIFAAANGEYK